MKLKKNLMSAVGHRTNRKNTNGKNTFDEYEQDCNFILTDASGKNFFIQI